MFLDLLYEGSTGLSYVKLVAVLARNFVDNIFKTGRGSGRLSVRQQRLETGRGMERGTDVIAFHFQRFLHGQRMGFVVWNGSNEVAGGATMRLAAVGSGSL